MQTQRHARRVIVGPVFTRDALIANNLHRLRDDLCRVGIHSARQLTAFQRSLGNIATIGIALERDMKPSASPAAMTSDPGEANSGTCGTTALHARAIAWA